MSARLRTAVFPVQEGDVILQFPADMSAEELEALGEYLSVFLKWETREISRRCALAPAPGGEPQETEEDAGWRHTRR